MSVVPPAIPIQQIMQYFHVLLLHVTGMHITRTREVPVAIHATRQEEADNYKYYKNILFKRTLKQKFNY